MSLKKQLEPLSIYAVFGINTENFNGMGILITSDIIHTLYPCVPMLTGGLKAYSAPYQIFVDIESAEFQSAVQINNDPIDREDIKITNDNLAPMVFPIENSEKEWLKTYFNLIDHRLGPHAEKIFEYGSANTSGTVIKLLALLKTDDKFL
ncbi:hypothetical protein DFH11DRAFT_1075822 [Phellopilus nigrolimitatus]|nr:hypothetical protein DFH11DRAFT_1075822 [Phellopilus nigrolimitatus]